MFSGSVRAATLPRASFEARSAPEDRQEQGPKVSRNSNPVRTSTPIGGSKSDFRGAPPHPAAAAKLGTGLRTGAAIGHQPE